MPLKSQVTIKTISDKVVAEVSQQPGPIAKATTVAVPTSAKQAKKSRWLAVWPDEPSLTRAAQALINPSAWMPINIQKAAGQSNPFNAVIGGRFLSVCTDHTAIR